MVNSNEERKVTFSSIEIQELKLKFIWSEEHIYVLSLKFHQNNLFKKFDLVN
jgi:hypothetical protein